MKLLIMQSSPASRHFLPLRSKYSPQHPFLTHPQSMFIPSFERQIFTLIKKTLTSERSEKEKDFELNDNKQFPNSTSS
jgi:hypothetical protein